MTQFVGMTDSDPDQLNYNNIKAISVSLFYFFLATVLILLACLFDHVKALSSSLMLYFFTVFLNEENSGMFCCNLPMHCIRVKSSSVYLCTCVYAIFFLSSIFSDGMDFEDAIFLCVYYSRFP